MNTNYTNKDGLIKVRCKNYSSGYGNKMCRTLYIDCVSNYIPGINICREPVLIDWIEYIKYKHAVKIVED